MYVCVCVCVWSAAATTAASFSPRLRSVRQHHAEVGRCGPSSRRLTGSQLVTLPYSSVCGVGEGVDYLPCAYSGRVPLAFYSMCL